jgi:hypothetical protein
MRIRAVNRSEATNLPIGSHSKDRCLAGGVDVLVTCTPTPATLGMIGHRSSLDEGRQLGNVAHEMS